MTLNIDIAPTLLDLAGVKAPPMQGRNLVPLVEGESVPWRKEWFYEHLFGHDWIPQTEGVRTDTRKYTRYLDTKPMFEELFDLSADPLEELNLAGDSGRRSMLDELRGRWKLWREKLEAWRPGQQWRDPA